MSIARNTLAYWLFQVGDYALRFITMVLVAVALGRDLRGLLFSVLMVNNLAASFTSMGLQNMGMFFAAKSPREISRIHTLLVIIVGGIVLFDFALLAAAGDWPRVHIFDSPPPAWFFLALSLLPFSLYAIAAQGILTGLGRVRELSRILFYYSFVSSAGNLIAFAALNRNPERLVPALIGVWFVLEVGKAVIFFGALRLAGCRWVSLPAREIVGGARGMLSYGLRAFSGNFAGLLVNKLDQIVILAAIGRAGLGVYTVAVRLGELVFYPAAALESAGFAQVAGQSRADAARLTRDLFRSSLLVNGLGMAALLIVARPFMMLLFGQEYERAIAPLRILLPGVWLFSASRMFSLYFSAQLGRPLIPAAAGWAAALVDVALMRLLASRGALTMTGIAWVTSASYAVVFVILLTAFVRRTGLTNPCEYFIPQRRDMDRFAALARGVMLRRGV